MFRCSYEPILGLLMIVLICWGGEGLYILFSFASRSDRPTGYGPVLRGCGGGSLAYYTLVYT